MIAQTVAKALYAEFSPLYDDLTRGDLQAVIEAASLRYNLSAGERWDVENLALEMIDNDHLL